METNKLTIIEIRYIRSLAAVKTDEELAIMIEKPVELIKAQFALMAGLPRRPGEKIILERLPPPPESIPVPAKEKPVKKVKAGSRTKAGSQRDKQAKKAVKKRVQVQVNEKVLQRQKEWKRNNETIQYETKQPVDSDTIPYRLNHKTTIYAKPGTNIEELKKKYNIR